NAFFESALLGSALVSLAGLFLLLWLTWSRADAVGRIFAPAGLGGAVAIGCAAIRVFCLRELTVAVCGLAFRIPAAIAISRNVLFPRGGWSFWAVGWGL